MISKEQALPFFEYATKREAIRERRENGEPPPWTTDPVLREFRFCNVFREDDKTTRWFRENIRDPMKEDWMVLWATLVFRWFNKIETAERLMKAAWPSDPLRAFRCYDLALMSDTLSKVNPIVTGAYVINTPPRMKKLEGIIYCLSEAWENLTEMTDFIRHDQTLEEACQTLQQVPFLGPFMSYEVVTDLRHTVVLRNASDINTWANPGPGAARGLSRMLYASPVGFNRYSKKDTAKMIELMRCLLEHSRDGELWSGRPMEMREIEHTLCEFDKYERVRRGEGQPKQRYRNGA